MTAGLRASQIFAHRGFWSDTNLNPNSLSALQRAAEFNFSVETDLRNDAFGTWIAHDPLEISDALDAKLIFEFGNRVAINIKSDGLGVFALENIELIKSTNSFFFDGSLPQMFSMKKMGVPHALRLSEYESELPWPPDGIWLDAFESDWWLARDVSEFLLNFETVIVSPELHGRDPRFVWDAIYGLEEEIRARVGLCTDKPLEFLEWGSK